MVRPKLCTKYEVYSFTDYAVIFEGRLYQMFRGHDLGHNIFQRYYYVSLVQKIGTKLCKEFEPPSLYEVGRLLHYTKVE